MSKIGLFFGSFNPIHNGHLIIANYLAEYTDLEKIWFVVSPQNPLKQKKTLLAEYHRLELVRQAIDDYPKFEVSDVEFKLEKPSYTIKTLAYLKEKFPQHLFSLIMGADNLQTFDKWKNYETILADYQLYVYPRPGFAGGDFTKHSHVHFTEAPVMEVSSTFIRDSIKNKKDVRFYMPLKSYNYLKEMHFYEK